MSAKGKFISYQFNFNFLEKQNFDIIIFSRQNAILQFMQIPIIVTCASCVPTLQDSPDDDLKQPRWKHRQQISCWSHSDRKP